MDCKQKIQEAQVWIETILGRKMNADLFDELQDGTVLCEVCNKIKPGTCNKFKKTKIAFVARSNIDIFVKGAKKLGVRETDLFETRDLYDKQRLSAVVQAVYAVSGVSRKHGFPGPFIGALIHETGKLHKAVKLSAFDLGGNDVIYGGLGDDFIHAGAGDDAVSGAEALEEFYNSKPVTDFNPLNYDPTTGKFADYDADNPLTKINGFFLNLSKLCCMI